MSVEADISNSAPATPAPAAPDGSGATAPVAPAPASATSTPANQESEITLKAGRSADVMARVREEMDRQYQAELERQKSPSSQTNAVAEGEASVEGTQPTTPNQAAEPPDEVASLRARLAEVERKEQERAELARAAELQNLNAQQQQELASLESDVEHARVLSEYSQAQLQQLQAEMAEAQRERDYETLDALNQQYQMVTYQAQVSARNHDRLTRMVAQQKQYYQTQYVNEREKAQAAAIEKIAKTYGLTMDDLKSADPNLKITNYFQVLEAVAKSLTTKLNGELSKERDEKKQLETRIRAQYRDQFDQTPGAQPHPSGGTTAGSNTGMEIRAGNSGNMLKRAFGG